MGSPDSAARRLERQARPYRRGGRPVLPAVELIATVADSAPGAHGAYSQRQSPATVARYLRAARRHGALLLLDIQPGRVPFMREVRALRRFLAEPDVSLALDPEWSIGPGQQPGRQIGSTDAATVNAALRGCGRTAPSSSTRRTRT
jgi:sugar/nucleoside kinase (ribokinase family)